jgi:NAD(P)-dependent dehydrogenase (short-subunit alcohol dehydrogenase family)
MNTISCEGRTVLVTGAGSGLGRSMALLLASSGAEVVAAVRRPETGETLVAEILAAGNRGSWVECDVRRRKHVEGAVQTAVERTGKLDVIIHNATGKTSAEIGTLENLDADFWEEIVSTNLRASFWFARASYPHLRDRKGTMILLTSGIALEAKGIQPLYGAAKSGIRALAKSLAQEWGPDGVTVNCLSPAAMTPAYERVFEQDPAWADHIRRSVPLGRIGDAMIDVAPTVVFLASSAARFMTGQTLVVTGGRTMLT